MISINHLKPEAIKFSRDLINDCINSFDNVKFYSAYLNMVSIVYNEGLMFLNDYSSQIGKLKINRRYNASAMRSYTDYSMSQVFEDYLTARDIEFKKSDLRKVISLRNLIAHDATALSSMNTLYSGDVPKTNIIGDLTKDIYESHLCCDFIDSYRDIVSGKKKVKR